MEFVDTELLIAELSIRSKCFIFAMVPLADGPVAYKLRSSGTVIEQCGMAKLLEHYTAKMMFEAPLIKDDDDDEIDEEADETPVP